MINRLLARFCIMLICYSSFANSNMTHEIQLCTNAYNHFWYAFEMVKANLKEKDSAVQLSQFSSEFSKIVTQNFHFEVQNLPVEPDFASTMSIVVDGIPDLANTAVFGIENFGEHHITSPFSVKIFSKSEGGRVYSMSTRDITYARNANAEGGCTVYLSQKNILCQVQKNAKGIPASKKALLSSIINNIVTAYALPAPQCFLWNAAPDTSYVDNTASDIEKKEG